MTNVRPQYLVALSGGADSVCLLLTLLEKGEVGAAAHCNFHLRGDESDRDEEFVRQLCLQRGVKLFVKHFDTQTEAEKTGESIEMAARRLRYEWFNAMIRDLGFDAVAVGHHQEDNAETLLLNLLRGTGLQGLAGMQRMSRKQGFPIYRPLLEWTKTDILQYLDKAAQTYVTDSTNADTHYRRNKLRHEVLPLLQTINPQIIRTLNQMAKNLTEANDIYQSSVHDMATQCGLTNVAQHRGYKQVDYAALRQHHFAHAILRELLMPYAFSDAQVRDALSMGVGGVIENEQGYVTRSEDLLIFGPVPRTIKAETIFRSKSECLCSEDIIDGSLSIINRLVTYNKDLSLKCARNEIKIDADAVCGQLTLRPVAEGDRFTPFGMKGGSQLLSDYMTNHHFTRLDKRLAMVLADERGIVWLIGERCDERLRVTENTRKVLHFVVHNIG